VDEVRQQLEELIGEQVRFAIHSDNLENLYHPAPQECWARFALANSPKRTVPKWSRDLDLSRTTPILPHPVVITTHYAYGARKTSSALPSRAAS
jgi:hypothetical protein